MSVIKEKYTSETTMLPGVRQLTVLLKQKEITVGDGLKIQSFFVQEGNGAPYVVQVLGDDADLEAGSSYTCVMRERKQTRESDGRVFTEIQVAAAQGS